MPSDLIPVGDIAAWVYATLLLVILSALGISVSVAEPHESRAGRGALTALVVPTVLIVMALFSAGHASGNDPGMTGLWIHGLTLFRLYGGRHPLSDDDLSTTAGRIGVGVAIAGVLGGFLFAYVTARNPVGRDRVVERLSSWWFRALALARTPKRAMALVRRIVLLSTITGLVGFGVYTLAWPPIRAVLASQLRPAWILPGTPIRLPPTGVRDMYGTTAVLEASWQEIQLPGCRGLFSMARVGSAEMQMQFPDRSRRWVLPKESLNLPAIPKWVRGDGRVRVQVDCRP